MSDLEIDVFLLTESSTLLLACLRNYRDHGQRVDQDVALNLEPKVTALLARVRDRLPRRQPEGTQP